MADIFISYKSEDKAKAELLSEKLVAKGWTVWWDRDLIGGNDFDEDIARELSDAKVVVVIWSELSIHSRFVKDEARLALENKKLIPVSYDKSKAPIGFGMVQIVHLSDGVFQDDKYEKLYTSINYKFTHKKEGLPLPTKRATIKLARIFAILILSGIVAFVIYQITLKNPGKESLYNKAGRINEMLLFGKYDDVRAMMLEGAKVNIPRDTLIKAGDSAYSLLGTFIKTTDTSFVKDLPFSYYDVYNQFQKGVWVNRIIFDDAGNIYGLFLRTTPRIGGQ